MQYSSFLVRCWIQPESRTSFQVEHVQSGEQFRTASLQEAMAWLESATKKWQNQQHEES
ncbi:MAG: hypothetical protein JNL98_16685 [Bryobacterales bacterium]|nr:hypothetical protein [Bryobacterales bacterium]